MSEIDSALATPRCTVTVLITSFNRRATTLACLQALHASQGLDEIDLKVVLVDDSSSDGTAEAVSRQFPGVRVEVGDGSLFWCRGMHRAMLIAAQEPYDYFLWLNDDTLLAANALRRMLVCGRELRSKRGCPVVVVGVTVDAKTGVSTYGGVRRASSWNPMRFQLIGPKSEPGRCATMNGNCVLVSAEATAIVGHIDPAFEHSMGDTDFGLRAEARGVEVWQAPGIVGTCSANDALLSFSDPALPLPRRWRLFTGRKILPWKSWLQLTRRHGGFAWPIVFAWPYARVLAEGARQDLKRMLSRQHRET